MNVSRNRCKTIVRGALGLFWRGSWKNRARGMKWIEEKEARVL